METSDDLLFNIACFISGLFLLEYGADKFIDHTAIVAKRLNVSPTLVGLLTCGGEWEELVVIIVSLGQGQPSMGLGNLMGSSVANILASFSLGLLFIGSATFDRSSKIYTAALLGLTLLFLVFLYTLNATMKWVAGVFLVCTFGVYVASVAALIYRGTLTAPEADSDSDSDSDSSDSTSNNEDESNDDDDGRRAVEESDSENGDVARRRSGSLLSNPPTAAKPARRRRKPAKLRMSKKPRFRPMSYHVFRLFLGLGALLLASYIIAHSAAVIGEELGLSDTVVGTTILSLATTLPEKFVAVLGGMRKQPGIMVANTVGSNIFLITLCGGVLFLGGDAEQIELGFTAFEAMAVWVSAAVISVIVLTGGKSWMGGVCISMYVMYLVFEVTHGRRIDDD